MSIKVDLTGYYTYTAYSVIGDDGKMAFTVTINEADHTIQGSGADHPGQFVIAGFLIGDDVRFTKQYVNSNGNAAWKYIGKRLEPKGNVYQFVGGWGQDSWQGGQWVLAGVATPFNAHYPIEGQWVGNYRYAADINRQDGPMNVTISLDKSVPYVENGPYAFVGTGSDSIGAFKIKGTVTRDGVLSLQKTYDVGGLTWHYQGLYDPAGAMGGIWSGVGGSGSFELLQKKYLPKEIAQAIIPQNRMLHVADASNAAVSNAIDSLTAANTVPAASLKSLLTGFSSM